jgi:hypothetical protein
MVLAVSLVRLVVDLVQLRTCKPFCHPAGSIDISEILLVSSGEEASATSDHSTPAAVSLRHSPVVLIGSLRDIFPGRTILADIVEISLPSTIVKK